MKQGARSVTMREVRMLFLTVHGGIGVVAGAWLAREVPAVGAQILAGLLIAASAVQLAAAIYDLLTPGRNETE